MYPNRYNHLSEGVHLWLAVGGKNLYVIYLQMFIYISVNIFKKIVSCLLLNSCMICHDKQFCHKKL